MSSNSSTSPKSGSVVARLACLIFALLPTVVQAGEYDIRDVEPMPKIPGGIYSQAVSPSGRYLLFIVDHPFDQLTLHDEHEFRLILYELATGRQTLIPIDPLTDSQTIGYSMSCPFSPDETKLVVCRPSGPDRQTLAVYSIPDGTITDLPLTSPRTLYASFGGDGKTIFAATQAQDPKAKVLHVTYRVDLPSGKVRSMPGVIGLGAISPDGKLIYVFGGYGANYRGGQRQLLDASSGRMLAVLPSAAGNSVHGDQFGWYMGGKYLAYDDHQQGPDNYMHIVRICDGKTGRELTHFDHTELLSAPGPTMLLMLSKRMGPARIVTAFGSALFNGRELLVQKDPSALRVYLAGGDVVLGYSPVDRRRATRDYWGRISTTPPDPAPRPAK